MINTYCKSPSFTSTVYLVDNGKAYSKYSNPATNPEINTQILLGAIRGLEQNGNDDIVTIKMNDDEKLQLQVKYMYGHNACIGNSTIDKLTIQSALFAYNEAQRNAEPITRCKLAGYII